MFFCNVWSLDTFITYGGRIRITLSRDRSCWPLGSLLGAEQQYAEQLCVQA
jgi:hypothetical protein